MPISQQSQQERFSSTSRLESLPILFVKVLPANNFHAFQIPNQGKANYCDNWNGRIDTRKFILPAGTGKKTTLEVIKKKHGFQAETPSTIEEKKNIETM